ncbi:hypothetical protein DFQ28_008753 [Apophysomyces sp. BC1034]|nr:hypothetical protein DFQ30_004972 [Apophysomyces sp. BC1015]KAG0174556.1 hypothetical protein DFQ29_007437 [Apophysomyces sp. BC1021]KAG0185792.1 hypothetical protein DFQ28_008753 [Apophysomyces sp. BC1034]
MSSTEYGTVPTDQEAIFQEETRWQKFKRVLHLHGHRVLITWVTVIAVTIVLTLSFHFALSSKHKPVGSDDLLDAQCVSDRSWFVALLLSIFLGPFGVDRFYLGYVFLGIVKLLTAGLAGIWWTVDVILIGLNVLTDHPDGCHLH